MVELVPVFPLPNAVLFPHTRLPLHVFEPRYRAMVRDATAGEGLIAVALLCPGFEEDYEGSPAYHPVGTVGRVEELERLPDGRFNLTLVGMERVELQEIPSEKPYRIARATRRPERVVDESAPGLLEAKLDLMASQGYLLRELAEASVPGIILDERLPFETAVNGACANLPVEPHLRQELLELDDPRDRRSRAAEMIEEVLEAVLKLKRDLRSQEMN